MVCASVVSSLVFDLIWSSNISESFLSALFFSVPKGENGAAGAGFFSALVNYVSTWVSESAEEIPGIVVLSGKNSTAPVIRYSLVLEM